MGAGAEDVHDVPVGHDRRDRDDAAAEGLAEQVDVGVHVLGLAGERVAGAAEAGLDLVGDHQDAVRVAEPRGPREVALGGTMTPASP